MTKQQATDALVACLDGEADKAEDILDGLTRGELHTLLSAVFWLETCVKFALTKKKGEKR